MNNLLYSIILELQATHDATLPATMGHQTHGLFLNLISQVDAELATRLHDEAGYKPFTVSALSGATRQRNNLLLRKGHSYRFRVTLLDGGQIWRCLSGYFLGPGMQQNVRLGDAEFALQKIQSTPLARQDNWAANTDWQALAHTEPQQTITMRFASPTAFSLGDRKFALFPEPILLWDSLMRSWNLYTPEVLALEKPAIREFVRQHVTITEYKLNTETLYFPKHQQKGFVGSCTYAIMQASDGYAAQLTALAKFARYAGVGYRTTMGMGQTCMEGGASTKNGPKSVLTREARL